MGFKSKVEKMPGYNTLVRPVHYAQAARAGVKFGWPAKRLRVIGVTGTNGKTTTCFMIWRMLREAGYRAGILTTVGWGVDEIQAQIEHMTTERVEVLNERMRRIAEAGAEFLVLEVTSHALMQARTLGVPIEIAVFTNITHEHLDYHKTFKRYMAAKRRLFRKAKYGIVNSDDPNAAYFMAAFSPAITSSGSPVRAHRMSNTPRLRASSLPRTSSTRDAALDQNMHQVNNGDLDYASCDMTTYGIEHGKLRATEVELLPGGVRYACGDMKIETKIPGRFNVYNSLAAVAVGKKLGLSDEEIEKGIFALESVEGRMNLIDEGQNFNVIVDYAHTPDAIENVFSSVSAEGRIIAGHGGAGRRDASTRAERGEILGRKANIVIITEDDSRDEDPGGIAEMFAEGAERAGKKRGENLYIEIDREKAIRKAIGMAKKGDLVLILGKGHEKTILRKDGAHPFEDAKVARKILQELKNKR